MKRHTLAFCALLLLASAVVSCGKKSDPKSKTELISRKWKFSKVESTPATTRDFSAYTLSFDAGNFTRTDGSASASGTWKFAASETEIEFASGTPAKVKIIELTEGTLTISYSQINSKQVTENITLYLVPA